MSLAVRQQEPKAVWQCFADLNAVPRPSKKEERIIAFMVNFAKQLNLDVLVDNVGNVIVKKPATKGFENRKTVVLQSHLDMVHQKNTDTKFDFNTQGINMYVDGDWVKADGTTLGADNGLGVAAIMAILKSTTIAHPNLEALFTIDEETGMTGAMGLEKGILNGRILLNLDTEEDDEIGIGCAGGIDITATKTYITEPTPENAIGFNLTITGLKGGHSGMDIDKGLGNANKLLNRLLFNAYTNFGLRISEINGGSLRNAIPRESFATITVKNTKKDKFIEYLNQKITAIKTEFKSLEPDLNITLTETELPKTVIDVASQNQLTQAIYATLNGVYRMSPDIKDLVETSNNIAKVTVKNNNITVLCLARSSSETNKTDVSNTITSAFSLAGFNVELSGNYPGWQPNTDSEILSIVSKLYEKINSKKAHIAACHAGLECGILGQNYPNIDMISFGPTIRGAHSPDERASISSTQKFWQFLQEILKNTPTK